jgi:hypothetical protein
MMRGNFGLVRGKRDNWQRLPFRIEQEQRSEGKYGNDKGYGRIAYRGKDEAKNLP